MSPTAAGEVVGRSFILGAMNLSWVLARSAVVGAVVACAGGVLGQAPLPTKQAIYSLLQTRQYAQAESAARAYLKATPQDCTVHTMLGLALRGEGRMDAAFASLRTAVKLCPTSVPVLESAAEAAYAGHLPEAEGLLGQLLTLRPEDATAHAMLGSIEARDGRCAAAVEDDAKGMAQVGRSSAALRPYAGCLVTLGRVADAVGVLEQLLALEESPTNRMALARAQMDAGKRAEALATLQPLIGEGTADDRALLLAAQVAEADNHTPQAIAWLRQAMQIAPKHAENYLYFAEVSFTHGSYPVGVDFLNLGLKELPGDARLLVARGVLEVQLSKADLALADFQEAHRVDPKLSFAEDAMGVLFSQRRDGAGNSKSLEFFAEKVKAQPNDPLLEYLYAEALSEGDETKLAAAIAAAKRSVALEPSYQPARDLLCLLLLRQGDLQGVVEQAAEAMRRDPYDESALYQAMLAERRLHHPEKVGALVKQLQAAKSHNQVAVTKYMLQEDGR